MTSSRARRRSPSRLLLALVASAGGACVLPGADLVEGDGSGGDAPTSTPSSSSTSTTTSSASGSGGDAQGGGGSSTASSSTSAGGGGSGGDATTSTGIGGTGGSGAGGTGGVGGTGGDGGAGGDGGTGGDGGSDGGGGSAPLPVPIQLDAGNGHACIVRDDETAHCWGRNDRDQLGYPTEPRGESWFPAQAQELATGVLAIALGDRFTCAVVRGAGVDETRVRCWGEDTDGQTGGVGVDQPTKIEYPAGGADVEDIVELEAGYRFACARIQGGDVTCWGDGSQRSLGLARPDSPDAIDIALDEDAIDIGLHATASMACAVLAGGAVQCWGDGFDVESVPETDNATAVSVGAIGTTAPGGSEVVFVIDDRGRVAWNRRVAGVWADYEGFGEFGEEVDIGEARDVEVGLHEVCVVTVDDDLFCAPHGVDGLPDEGALALVAGGVAQVALGAAGASYVGPTFGTRCVRFIDGATQCQGSNVEGGLGNGRELFERSPVPVVGPTDVRGLSLGGKATISFEGDAPTSSAWGESTVLGVVDAITPVSPTPLIPVGTSRLDFGRFASDEAYVWGATTMFHLRVNELVDDSVRLPALALPFVEGKAATIRDIGRTDAGAVVTLCRTPTCNSYGAMGNGNDAPPNPLSHTLDLGTFVASEVFGTATASHHCALGVDGGAEQLICWGRSNFGQVGDGTTGGEVQTPTVVIASGARDACIGTNHTCAVVDDGVESAVQCWGRAGLGGPPVDDQAEPFTMPGTQGALGVTCGLEFTCTWLGDGSVLCWGENEDGQLGDGTIDAHAMPALVDDLADVVEVVAGTAHACAIHTSRTLSCWGRNDDGQVGVDVPIFYDTLVDVAFGDGT